MGVRLDADKVATGFKVGDDSLSRLVSVHSGILPAKLVDRAVVGDYLYYLKVVALSDLEVIRVVRGSDFDAAGTEAYVNIFVGDHGDLSADKGQDERLSDE